MSVIKPGIYLEIKKGVIGTGSTAKGVEFRNLWMTIAWDEEKVSLMHLNDDFTPTGAFNTIQPSDLRKDCYTHLNEEQNKFDLIFRQLRDKLAKEKIQEEKTGSQTNEVKQPTGWWETRPKEINPGDIFKLEDPGKDSNEPDGQNPGDIFRLRYSNKKRSDNFEAARRDIFRLEPSQPKTTGQASPTQKAPGKKKAPAVTRRDNWWQT